MNPVTQHLISSYLLMPLLTVIFGIAAYFIARKNKLLNNKKLIAYLLLCGIILALPGLSGFMDYNFMPYAYILLVILYWTAGYYNRLILRKVFASSKEMPSFGIQCLLTVTVVLLGAGLFSVVFNLCNELQYGIWASTCLLPFAFRFAQIQNDQPGKYGASGQDVHGLPLSLKVGAIQFIRSTQAQRGNRRRAQ